MPKRAAIEDVLTARTPEWMALRGVVGVAQGNADGQACIIVYITDAMVRSLLPERIDGFDVRVELTEPFTT